MMAAATFTAISLSWLGVAILGALIQLGLLGRSIGDYRYLTKASQNGLRSHVAITSIIIFTSTLTYQLASLTCAMIEIENLNIHTDNKITTLAYVVMGITVLSAIFSIAIYRRKLIVVNMIKRLEQKAGLDVVNDNG